MSDEDGRTYVVNGKLIVPWRLTDGRVIHLLTPEEFKDLPDGTTVISISNETLVKGRDKIDHETPRGRLPFGLLQTKNKN